MESGTELSARNDNATVRVAEERPAAKKRRNFWWTEENWLRLNKLLVNSRYPAMRGQCNEACLVLRFDPVPKQTVFNVLQRIGRKTITYKNYLPMKKR